jgi:nucleolar protein 14
MPPSQLKRLKASLREHGITGPQKSKKQKKQAAKSGQRIQRDVALTSIRESFNPFEVKAATRPNKMDVTTAKTMNGSGKSGVQVLGRPAVTKSMGEETRRKTLLTEVQNRNKVGGILDRRIGENDPTLAPEERALQRFQREKEREGKRGAVFDLELEDGDEEEPLTHGGRSLVLGRDDFEEGSLGASSDDEDDDETIHSKRKRQDFEDEELGDDDVVEDGPERKKTKAEVMKEVIAKSKLYKYERQAAKEEDEVAREELDKGVGDLRQALFAFQNSLLNPRSNLAPQKQENTSSGPSMNPDRAALMDATLDPDKDYDLQIRRMALDKRSKPTDRTQTEEQKATHDAARLKELEETRLKRMRGEEEDEDEPEQSKNHPTGDVEVIEYDEEVDDAAEFGLSSGLVLDRPAGFEDEDEFIIDEELVASGSEMEDVESDDESAGSNAADEAAQQEDNDFIYGHGPEKDRTASSAGLGTVKSCPKTYEDILQLLNGVKPEDVHFVIRKVRQVYDAGLSSSNKQKLSDFSEALIEYLGSRPNSPGAPPLMVFEMIIRHAHSLSRTYADAIGRKLRVHLEAMHKEQSMSPGDLMILTAIGTIYPTSDHFHQVVTPAVTLMARWLGLTTPKEALDLNTGAYLGALCLKYQSFAKRYIPELVRFTVMALRSKQPSDTLEPHIINLLAMANLWSSKSAFIEIFSPLALKTLQTLSQTKPHHQLQLFLSQAQLSRHPLGLHHHRPLPIKTAIPKFEESFNPDKHYDPDRERAESAKLQKEYKREKKGALRELRKDANFLAREKLREKREKDKAYEEKYRRLVAEIQGEEGRESNAYEREKRMRKGRK